MLFAIKRSLSDSNLHSKFASQCCSRCWLQLSETFRISNPSQRMTRMQPDNDCFFLATCARLSWSVSFWVSVIGLLFFRIVSYAERGIATASRLSVRPPVMLEFFENNFTLSWLGIFALHRPNITGLLHREKREHAEILARIGKGYRKTAFGVQTL